MNPIQKEYHVGIDYGTSNSCVGIFMNGNVHIAPNRLGERTTPSVVSFSSDNKAIVGEDTISQNIDDYKNIIYEVKRFIGLSYEEFTKRDFSKNLNYDVVNVNNVPKIKININDKDYFYSAIEISSLIIKKMVQNAEDFIAEIHQGVKITKAVLTVPAHFDNNQIAAVKEAAELAGIEVARIINEPTAAALAYGLGNNLMVNDKNNINEKNILYNSMSHGDDCDAPNPFQILKEGSSEKAIVFDLGGGTLDVTLLNINKNNDGNVDFDVLATDGNIHLGGSDFDNKLIDFCINEFCRETGHPEEEIRQDKKACRRLKIKCEHAKKLLSITQETVINIDNFYGQDDLMIRISRDTFETICKDLYDEIDKIIISIMEGYSSELTLADIDEVILVGGATKMVGIKNFLCHKFGPAKVKSNLNPDEAVAFGATLGRAKMEENDKINFNLQDIVAYNLGIEVANNKMDIIVKKFTKIPCCKEKKYKIVLTNENPDIAINVYEGNNDLVEKNKFLATIYFNNLNKTGEIIYTVKFTVDVNSKLRINLIAESLGIEKEEEIKNITHALADSSTKKIKILKTKVLTPMISINAMLNTNINNLKASRTDEEKIKNLNICIKIQEDKVNNYVVFLKDNETAYEYVYTSTKELFNFYIDLFKLKKSQQVNIEEVISKIKEFMKNLVSAIGYLSDLLHMFTEIKKLGCNNEFFEIFVNYIEILNNEALGKKDNKKFSRYYCKLYFERVFYDIRKYISNSDLEIMDTKIKEKYLQQKQKNEEELKKANSFADFIEKRLKEGKFVFGKTGFTAIGKKIERFEENMDDLTEEETQEVLDIYENMAGSFDKTKYSLGELYCLGNIIYINNQIFNRGYKKLWKDINRFETILNHNIDTDFDWIDTIKEIIKEILKNKNIN